MPRRSRNASQLELPQEHVVPRHHAVAFKDTDEHRLLVVVSCGEVLDLAAGDGRVAPDGLVHVALACFLDLDYQHTTHAGMSLGLGTSEHTRPTLLRESGPK